MLKKFEHLVTISLVVVLIWMLLTCSYSNAQGKMFKFLELVKLEVASISANLKTA